MSKQEEMGPKKAPQNAKNRLIWQAPTAEKVQNQEVLATVTDVSWVEV